MTFYEEQCKQAWKTTQANLWYLPPFCRLYFDYSESKMSAKTLSVRSFTLKSFFKFIIENIDEFKHLSTVDFSLGYVKQIKTEHIEMFKQNFIDNGLKLSVANNNVSTVRAFFKFYVDKRYVSFNPAQGVPHDKRKRLPIVKLSEQEATAFLQAISHDKREENNVHMINDWIVKRDKTIMILFLGTGIRISELIGLNTHDVDFANSQFTVTLKGGKSGTIYMNDYVKEHLQKYFDYKKFNHEQNAPLFASQTHDRICTVTLTDIIKKYAKWAGINKKVTSHTLRKTFGCNIYNATGDIFMTAKLLNHVDVATTTKHYVDIDEDKKRDALQKLKMM